MLIPINIAGMFTGLANAVPTSTPKVLSALELEYLFASAVALELQADSRAGDSCFGSVTAMPCGFEWKLASENSGRTGGYG